jgi:8-oxo-dGTP pyrophosphatase MutT (NUDIX family)
VAALPLRVIRPAAAHLMRSLTQMFRRIFGRPDDRPRPEPTVQSGALPYRIGAKGVEILLIRTSRSKRWSIPKGNAVSHLTLAANAAKEAFEEAGVTGEIAASASGMYRAAKRTWHGDALVEVWVYLLAVTGQSEDWPEKGRRQTKWMSHRAAAAVLREPLLVSLCQEIGRAKAP